MSRHWGVDGRNLERAYKDWLSDFHEWEQLDHAEEWMLLPDNIGISMSIDETSLNGELYTILTNKAGHGKAGHDSGHDKGHEGQRSCTRP